MDRLFNDFTVNLYSKALDGHVATHRIISNNVANVNTPKYKASHVNFKERLHKALDAHNSGLAVEIPPHNSGLPVETAPRHLPLEDTNLLKGFMPDVDVERNTIMRLDGNNVDIDAEMAKMAENSHEYAVIIRLVSDRFSGLRSAILGR